MQRKVGLERQQGPNICLFFFNPSLRTRISFESAATELGGHAQFLEPKTMRLKKTSQGVEVQAGETIEDAAKVLDRYGVGMGVKCLVICDGGHTSLAAAIGVD